MKIPKIFTRGCKCDTCRRIYMVFRISKYLISNDYRAKFYGEYKGYTYVKTILGFNVFIPTQPTNER